MKKKLLAAGVVIFFAAGTLLLKAAPVENFLVSAKAVQFLVNGKKIAPQSSSLPSALSYNGTLYVPLRLLVAALNVPIKWDPSTQTVSINEETQTTQFYLSDLSTGENGELASREAVILNNQHLNPPAGAHAGAYWQPPMNIAGTPYDKGISIQLFNGDTTQLTWKLDGKYSSLQGILGLDAQTHSGSAQDNDAYGRTMATLTFTGDGRNLASIEIGASTSPSTVSLPLGGVRQLTMRIQMQTDPHNLAMLDFVNPLLR